MTGTESLADEDPRTIARALLAEFGYSADQFSCLDSLWMSESGWRVDADNPNSSAYGIPQALPGSKMAVRRRRLGDQPGDPDPLGPRLHPGPLRQPVLGVGASSTAAAGTDHQSGFCGFCRARPDVLQLWPDATRALPVSLHGRNHT